MSGILQWQPREEGSPAAPIDKCMIPLIRAYKWMGGDILHRRYLGDMTSLLLWN